MEFCIMTVTGIQTYISCFDVLHYCAYSPYLSLPDYLSFTNSIDTARHGLSEQQFKFHSKSQKLVRCIVGIRFFVNKIRKIYG